MTIPQQFHDLFDRRSIATIGTTLPDGSPHVVPVWVDYDGEHLLSAGGRYDRRHRNLERDPRVSLTILDPNPYRALHVQGEVVAMETSGAIEFLDKQAKRYWGVEEFPFNRGKDRYLLRIEPQEVIDVSSHTPQGFEAE